MRHFVTYDPVPALASPNATFLLMDGLNHMFQTAETGVIAEYIEIDETFNGDFRLHHARECVRQAVNGLE